MNPRPDEWKDPVYKGWPPPVGIYQPSPLPPEFWWENADLAVPRKEEESLTADNFLFFRPFF